MVIEAPKPYVRILDDIASTIDAFDPWHARYLMEGTTISLNDAIFRVEITRECQRAAERVLQTVSHLEATASDPSDQEHVRSTKLQALAALEVLRSELDKCEPSERARNIGL